MVNDTHTRRRRLTYNERDAVGVGDGRVLLVGSNGLQAARQLCRLASNVSMLHAAQANKMFYHRSDGTLNNQILCFTSDH